MSRKRAVDYCHEKPRKALCYNVFGYVPPLWSRQPGNGGLGFRILHTDRRLNPQTDQWEDGRTSAADVNFYGMTAERYARTIAQQSGLYAKGVAVVAWGEMSDRPGAYVDRDGTAQAMPVINGTRIIPNQPVNQRRADRWQTTGLP